MGRMRIAMPRAQRLGEVGRQREFKSALLPRYRHLTMSAAMLIANAYLAGAKPVVILGSLQRVPSSTRRACTA